MKYLKEENREIQDRPTDAEKSPFAPATERNADGESGVIEQVLRLLFQEFTLSCADLTSFLLTKDAISQRGHQISPMTPKSSYTRSGAILTPTPGLLTIVTYPHKIHVRLDFSHLSHILTFITRFDIRTDFLTVVTISHE